MFSPLAKALIVLAGSTIVLTVTTFSLGYFGLSTVEWTSLATEIEKGEAYNSTRVGHKFSHYLVGAFLVENKDWWHDAFRRYEKDQENNREFSREFLGVKKAFVYTYQDDPLRSLNRVCYRLYEERGDTEVFPKDRKTINNQQKFSSDFWRYCSDFLDTPWLIRDNLLIYKESTNGYTKKSEYIISVDKHENNKLWMYKHSKFFSKSREDILGDSYFLELYDGIGNRENPLSLKKHCSDLYRSEKNKELLMKYCSLEQI